MNQVENDQITSSVSGYFTTMHPCNEGSSPLQDGELVFTHVEDDDGNQILTEIGKCVQIFEYNEKINVLGISTTCDFIFVAVSRDLYLSIQDKVAMKNELGQTQLLEPRERDLSTLNIDCVSKSGCATRVTQGRHVSTLAIYKTFKPRLPNTVTIINHPISSSSPSHFLLVHGIAFAARGDSGGLVWHHGDDDDDGRVHQVGLMVGSIWNGLFYIVYPVVFIEKALEIKNKRIVWEL